MTLNLLPIAMQATAILGCNKKFTYIEYSDSETTINDLGFEIPVMKFQAEYTGSVQAVQNKMYEQMGLDLSKNYKLVYCPQLIKSLSEKDHTGKILYNDSVWEVIENQNWWETNGFTKFIMVEIKRDRLEDVNTQQIQNQEPDFSGFCSINEQCPKRF